MTRPERRTSSPLVARLTPLHGRPTQRAVLAELRRVDRRFEPSPDDDARVAGRRAWSRAVARSRGWAADD